MSEELLKEMRKRIKVGDEALKGARELITRLKVAGEDVSALERQYVATKARVDRYKKAFGV